MTPPQLMVASEQLHREIDERLIKGQELIDRSAGDEKALRGRRQEYYSWTEYNEALLRRSFDGAEPADEYARRPAAFVIGGPPDPIPKQWQELFDDISGKMRRLRSLQDRLPLFRVHQAALTVVPSPRVQGSTGSEVFIVHGHDGATKTTVARFLSKLLGKEPVILHEQPDRGWTIIEKFEHHAAKTVCAVVLLTADDEGGAVGKPHQLRARQNVVFELGYFLAKLGRGRVVILYEPDVELPSDISGVLYIQLDAAGLWRNLVARELREAEIDVDLGALLS